MEKGCIVYLNRNKNFGFIKNQKTNETIHFNFDHIYGQIEMGSLITYICHQTAKGPTAYGVVNLENSCQLGINFLNDTNYNNWYQRNQINDFFTEIIDEQNNLIFIEIRFNGWRRSSAPTGTNIWLKPGIENLNIVNFNNNIYNIKYYYQNCNMWYYIDTTKTAAEEAAEAAEQAAAEEAAAAAAAEEAAAEEAALAAEYQKAAEQLKSGTSANIFVEIDDGYCGNTAIVPINNYFNNDVEYDDYLYVISDIWEYKNLPAGAIIIKNCFGYYIPEVIKELWEKLPQQEKMSKSLDK